MTSEGLQELKALMSHREGSLETWSVRRSITIDLGVYSPALLDSSHMSSSSRLLVLSRSSSQALPLACTPLRVLVSLRVHIPTQPTSAAQCRREGKRDADQCAGQERCKDGPHVIFGRVIRGTASKSRSPPNPHFLRLRILLRFVFLLPVSHLHHHCHYHCLKQLLKPLKA
ncbi:hypothetical protein K402DRAFT_404898 [Aulographum hederae CBS 113979]|uniref:Uncharacterized protein n=1 Tax=Aulographum hederae CBS 113979 TaxID=1176131 RepID=A0A6G1GYC3_9PEZI|nr:hypothetical protein K402DRAFT_404898 [Aulographum hederae CBS 113979]